MLDDKTFLVVGGNSGIGRAIVDLLGKYNKVIVLDKTIENELVNQYECYTVDLRNRAAVFNFTKNVIETNEITNLIYAAGYQENVDILDMDIQNWDPMFDVNVFSAFIISQSIARNIVKKHEGVMVYISSIHGSIIREIPHYSASKAAQNMMMKEFAYKLAPFGGRAFSIAPGSIDTPLLRQDLSTKELFEAGERNIPMQRHGSANEIASLVYSALQINYITGSVLVVDGGLSLVI